MIGGDGAIADPDRRVLTRAKANYARNGETLSFRWWRWAFVRDDDMPPSQLGAVAAEVLAREQDARFLACLEKATEERRATSPNPSASNFAQRLLDRGDILNGQRVYQRDNRTWATGLGPAQTLHTGSNAARNEMSISHLNSAT